MVRIFCKGFTLIELSVVVAGLLLVAALVVPALQRQQESWNSSQAIPRIVRFLAEAREAAIVERATQVIRYDSSQREWSRTAEDDTETDGPRNVLDTMRLPEGFVVDGFTLRAGSVPESEFAVRFLADGSASPAAFEVLLEERLRTILVSPQGRVEIREEELPESLDERWPAGEFERRA